MRRAVGRSTICLLLCAVGIAAPAAAQTFNSALPYVLSPPSGVPYISLDSASAGVGDVNGDGMTDLVVAGTYTNFEGLGTSSTYVYTFLASYAQAPNAPGTPWLSPQSFSTFAVADFDGDGRADLAIAASDNTIKIAKGN